MKSTVIEDMNSKYKKGDVVIAKENPSLKLEVARYTSKIYYCAIHSDPTQKQVVYFERDLRGENEDKW